MSAGSSRVLFSRPLSYAGLRVAMALAVVVASTSVASAQSYSFSRLAGSSGGAGANDGIPADARFFRPAGIAIDATGTIYVADTENHIIRKIAPTGQVSTLAGLAGTPGNVDGTGSAARFWRPTGIGLDQAGNVFVADSSNHAIRRITQAGAVSTFAGALGSSGSNDGTGPVARFNIPNGLAIDGAGTIYVADTGNSTIRKITAAAVVSTFAGLPGVTGTSDGAGAGARFNQPEGVDVDATTGSVYVADTRVFREARHRRCLRPEDLQDLLDWAGSLAGPGVLVVGQPLLDEPQSWFGGTFADWSLPNYPEYSPIAQALAKARHSILVLTGDVHYPRVARVNRHDGRLQLLEVIASPLALVSGQHATPKPPPGKFQTMPVTQEEPRRGADNFALLQFTEASGRVNVRVRHYMIPGGWTPGQEFDLD